ncbi:hypothetical protein AOLI_G00069490 [Acnodon oligacanthus]
MSRENTVYSRAASRFQGRTAAEGENEKYRRLETVSLLNLGNELLSSPPKAEERPEAEADAIAVCMESCAGHQALL